MESWWHQETWKNLWQLPTRQSSSVTRRYCRSSHLARQVILLSFNNFCVILILVYFYFDIGFLNDLKACTWWGSSRSPWWNLISMSDMPSSFIPMKAWVVHINVDRRSPFVVEFRILQTIAGSTTFFTALLKKCLERNVVVICQYIFHGNSPPRFVALWPQVSWTRSKFSYMSSLMSYCAQMIGGRNGWE